MTNFSIRKILVGTEGAGVFWARVAVTRAAHFAGRPGEIHRYAPSQTEGATRMQRALRSAVQRTVASISPNSVWRDILHLLAPQRDVRALSLRVDPAEEVHALRLNVDLALVPGAVEAAELRVRDELLGGLPRQVAVTPGNVDAADAELPLSPWGSGLKA